MSSQEERLDKLIALLFEERGEKTPAISSVEKRRVYRALVNIRPPIKASDEFSALQDEYLREELRRKGVTAVAELTPISDGIYLWRGDITTLECDGIVNAANSQLLGCFCPNHGCIDNAIHTFAGVRLRSECAEIMKKQGCEEATGKAKLTLGYNLPCKYVLHTVGPIVSGGLTAKHERSRKSHRA